MSCCEQVEFPFLLSDSFHFLIFFLHRHRFMHSRLLHKRFFLCDLQYKNHLLTAKTKTMNFFCVACVGKTVQGKQPKSKAKSFENKRVE